MRSATNMEKSLRKNILNLQFQKYLAIATTSIVIALTYSLGVGIAYLSKDIGTERTEIAIILTTLSTIVFAGSAFFFFNALFHLKEIPERIKELAE